MGPLALRDQRPGDYVNVERRDPLCSEVSPDSASPTDATQSH